MARTGSLSTLNALRSPQVRYATAKKVDRERVKRLSAEYPDLIVLVSGGGNFGDLYPSEQEAHLNWARWFQYLPIRYMPQSIHFQSSDRISETAEVLSSHPDLQLFVRDQPSYDLATEYFGSKGVELHL